MSETGQTQQPANRRNATKADITTAALTVPL
jgi:hypothetical protein